MASRAVSVISLADYYLFSTRAFPVGLALSSMVALPFWLCLSRCSMQPRVCGGVLKAQFQMCDVGHWAVLEFNSWGTLQIMLGQRMQWYKTSPQLLSFGSSVVTLIIMILLLITIVMDIVQNNTITKVICCTFISAQGYLLRSQSQMYNEIETICSKLQCTTTTSYL